MMLVKPMKAKKDNNETLPGEGYIYEIKYDGIRVLIIWDRPHIAIYSKSGADITYKFPELTNPNNLGEIILGQRGIFDAELVCFKDGIPSFSAITSRFHSKEPDKIRRGVQENPVTACVFDVLGLEGDTTMDLALLVRKGILNSAILEGNGFEITKVHKDGAKLYSREKARGAEGIIAKRRGSLYLPGRRTKDWLKVKIMYEEQVMIYGFTSGLGKREGFFGALLFSDAGGTPLGNVGTGFTDKELAEMTEFLLSRGPKLIKWGEVSTYHLDKPFPAIIKGMRKNESGAIREPVFVKRI